MMLPNSKSHTEYGIAWNDAVNRCWEEFESRICKNCKYGSGVRSSRYNRDIDATHCSILNQKVAPDFGCNKFKRKGK